MKYREIHAIQFLEYIPVNNNNIYSFVILTIAGLTLPIAFGKSGKCDTNIFTFISFI
jgi:hypothetical protein